MRAKSLVKIGLLGVAIAGGAFADLTIVNQSFETPVTSSFDYIAGNCASGGTCSMTQDGWTWANTGPNNGGAGVSANNTAFTSGNNNAPDGAQVLFLQNQSSVSQNVSGFVQGVTYDVTFYLTHRQNFGDPNPIAFPQLAISIGGQNVVTGLAPPEGPQYTAESFIFTNTSALATQTLLIAQTLPTTDQTLFFDDIKISATPEPAYFGLLGAGMAGLVLARKRRAN
jgi:cell surface hyaluronidase